MFKVMDWQQLVSLTIVAAAAGLLLWRKLRRPPGGFLHDLPCGCTAASSEPARSSIVFHARKGERPRVVVKMR